MKITVDINFERGEVILNNDENYTAQCCWDDEAISVAAEWLIKGYLNDNRMSGRNI